MEEFRNTQSDTDSPERSGGEKPKKKRKLFILGSILIGVVVMLLVYFVLIATGVIRIRANELTIGTPSAVKTYDGTPLTAQDYEITSGALPARPLRTPRISGRTCLSASLFGFRN